MLVTPRFASAIVPFGMLTALAFLTGCAGTGIGTGSQTTALLLDDPTHYAPHQDPHYAPHGDPHYAPHGDPHEYPYDGAPTGEWGHDEGHVYPPEQPVVEPHGVGHRMLFWLPNRVLDILDLVRARVRVGPGWTFSVRLTELADLNMGAHRTFFLGLYGPRGGPVIPWPVGLEKFEGMEFSVMDATNENELHGANYGPMEVGLGFQVLIIGADVGVAIWEAFDLVAGIFLFDPQLDDF